ncbi:MAG TPA: 4a-hydroxytetrahydrobiopterin dehydratase [Candidatus Kapabacteria bacterium]|nr:4a-hydroxytetrahydrobiopterin dehydratase [Candidatus Kapabacteria bacterium]
MTDLASKECVPCRGGVPPMTPEEIGPIHNALGHSWSVVNAHHLHKEFAFPDFKTAIAFTNRVGEIAEREGHHPDIHLSWGRVAIEIWTHKVNGLTESDFILAAKIDKAL